MRTLLSKLRALLSGRRPLDADLAEELQSHLAMEIERAREQGLPDAAAHRRFGNSAAIAERARDAWGFPSLESLLGDIRYGWRALRRARGFSFLVILTLAAGIGLNTAIFSVVHTVLLNPLPYPGAERLVWFGELIGRAEGVSVTWVNFKYWRASNHTFETMAARQGPADITLTGRGDPQVARGFIVTSAYFGIVGMKPLLGRLFDDADDRAGAAPVVVLNHRFWAGTLGGDPHIVGATLTLNGKPYQVVGVTAPLWEPLRYDLYLPLGRQNGNLTDRAQHGPIRMIGRLKPGVTLAAARADLDAIMRHLAEVDPGPENTHRSFGKFWTEDIVGAERGTLLVLMEAAGLILLIACANVASLLLARNTTRTGELAVRMAIGAGRLRLARQLFTETAMLAAGGGLAGIAVAYAALRGFIALAPREIPRLAEATLDRPVLVFACALTLAAGLMAGLAPVLSVGRRDLTGALKEGLRLAGGGRQRQAMRNLLVVAEIALTFVLAFGSGLLLRSLIAAQNVSPGYDPRGVLSFSLRLSATDAKDPESAAQFYDRLLANLRAVPGVSGASSVFCGPGAGDCGDWWYFPAGRPAPPRNEVPFALTNTADSGYFHMLGVPMVEGREFEARDAASDAVIVNRAIARRWWPHSSAVGHQIKLGGPYMQGPTFTIVGVAGDVKQFERDRDSWPELYRPFSNDGPTARTILVRAAGDPQALVPSIRERLRALNPNLPLQKVATMEETLGAGLAQRRFSTVLLTIFAALAMLLAAVGIYGLLSYWVTVREAEIAIRLALGARPSGIVTWTGLHALRLTAIGVGFGLIGGCAAAAALEGMVFGIPPRSPWMMLAAVAAVAVLALAATAIPAWRAGRVDAAGRLHHA